MILRKNFFAMLLCFLCGISWQSFSQQVIYGTNQYVEYHKGTLPIVISVPHGGSLTPNTIPDRTCNNPTTVTDANTIDLANQINNSLYQLTGCYAHIVYCNLKRTKLDCNRNLADGACGNAEAVVAWNEFHTFIDTAQAISRRGYNDNIFYVDLHGHGHTLQRLELGYLLYDSELANPDSVLNTSAYINNSSIQNLVSGNVNNYTHAQLLRGTQALGTLLGNSGFPAVPSMQIPSPGTTTSYFSGGYNVANYTSYVPGNPVNGVQIECNYTGVRDNAANRKKFADSLSVVLLKYLNIHRNVSVQGCSGITLPIGLVSFSGQQKNGKTELKWTTLHSSGKNDFIIERCTDQKSFITIGKVKSQAQQTDESHQYTFTDVNCLNGTNYYRLRQIEENGQYTYSKTIAVKAVISKGLVTIYPNPVPGSSERIFVAGLEKGESEYTIVNAVGQDVTSGNIKNSKNVFIPKLKKGVYYFQLKGINRDFYESLKLLVD